MPRDHRPLIVVLLGTGFLVTLVVVTDPFVRPRPAELSPSTDAPPEPPPAVRPVYDFALLDPTAAAVLDGKRARFRAVLDSPPADRLGCVCYGCVTPDDVERTLFLRDGEADADGLEVEGVLHVLHHPSAVCGKTAFLGFTEYRLVGAERVAP